MVQFFSIMLLSNTHNNSQWLIMFSILVKDAQSLSLFPCVITQPQLWQMVHFLVESMRLGARGMHIMLLKSSTSLFQNLWFVHAGCFYPKEGGGFVWIFCFLLSSNGVGACRISRMLTPAYWLLSHDELVKLEPANSCDDKSDRQTIVASSYLKNLPSLMNMQQKGDGPMKTEPGIHFWL